MPHYIYVLHCPIANTVRYVGKSVEPEKRLKGHLSSAKNFAYRHHTSAWIRQLLAAGLEPVMEIVDEVPDGGNWQEVERSWISQAEEKGWNLTNSTAGGEGLDYLCPVAQAAYRANLSAGLKRYWDNPGRKEIARERSIRAWADPEITSRRIASMLSAWAAPGYAEKHASIMGEVLKRPDVVQKMSEAAKANFPNSALLQTIKSSEFSADQSKRLEGRWKDPEGRQKLNGARWTAEAKEAQAAEILGRKEKMKASITPEVLARRNASIKASWARRKAEKAAILAATAPTPYTESS